MLTVLALGGTHVAPRSLLDQPSLKAPGPSERSFQKQQGRQHPRTRAKAELWLSHTRAYTYICTLYTRTIRGEKISFTSLVGSVSSCAPYPYSQAFWASGAKLRVPPPHPRRLFCPSQGQVHSIFLIHLNQDLGGQVGRALFVVSAQ